MKKPSQWTVSLELAAIMWCFHPMLPHCSCPSHLLSWGADDTDTQKALPGWGLKVIFRSDLQSYVTRIRAALLKVRTRPPLFSIYSHSHDFTQFKYHLEPNDFHIYIFSFVSWNPDSYTQLPTWSRYGPLTGYSIDISSLIGLKLLIPFIQSSHLSWWKHLPSSSSG